MKLALALLVPCFLGASDLQAQRRQPTDSVDVTIRLTNSNKTPITDSVLVIFDRYDHAGAGVIKQVYVPVNNEIVIPKVPPARYYIEIACLGVHGERFNELTYVNNRRNNVFTYRVKRTSTFTPGLVVIPVEPIDMNKLEILKNN